MATVRSPNKKHNVINDVGKDDGNGGYPSYNKLVSTMKALQEPSVIKKTRSRKTTVSPLEEAPDQDTFSSFLEGILEAFGSLENKFQQLNATMFNNQKILEEKFDNIEKSFNAVNSRINIIEDRINELERGMNSTETTFNDFKASTSSKSLKNMQIQIDNLQQEKNDQIIILSGEKVKEGISNNDSLLDCGYKLLKSIPGFEPKVYQIEEATTVGKYNSVLKVRFKSPFRQQLFRLFYATKTKPFYISDYLIPTRLKLFHCLRALKRENEKIQSVFTKKGIIYYKMIDNKDPEKLFDEEDLQNLRIRLQ